MLCRRCPAVQESSTGCSTWQHPSNLLVVPVSQLAILAPAPGEHSTTRVNGSTVTPTTCHVCDRHTIQVVDTGWCMTVYSLPVAKVAIAAPTPCIHLESQTQQEDWIQCSTTAFVVQICCTIQGDPYWQKMQCYCDIFFGWQNVMQAACGSRKLRPMHGCSHEPYAAWTSQHLMYYIGPAHATRLMVWAGCNCVIAALVLSQLSRHQLLV
eukprot:GHUV01030033.1.p1 GENE.GHUV01030033.1~~GHUV01030033.1.p1  ORF type:complete len:210 (+),score=27.76 GHUV01030033.1:224-853(+)